MLTLALAYIEANSTNNWDAGGLYIITIILDFMILGSVFLMNREQHLLSKVAEECSEIAQIAIKAQLFCFYSHYPDQPEITNLDHLIVEINDLLAVISMIDKDIVDKIQFGNDKQKAKMLKVEKYLELSQERGRTEV